MARWDPWSDLFNLQNEVSRLVNDTLGSTSGYLGGMPPSTRAQATSAAYLPLDIRQSESEFEIEASVPGLTPEEVEVTCDNGVLTIRGEHKQAAEKAGTYLRRERAVYSFFRQLSLPSDAKDAEISAEFSNGVLTVHIPRAKAPAPRRIPVKGALAGGPHPVIEAGSTPVSSQS